MTCIECKTGKRATIIVEGCETSLQTLSYCSKCIFDALKTPEQEKYEKNDDFYYANIRWYNGDGSIGS